MQVTGINSHSPYSKISKQSKQNNDVSFGDSTREAKQMVKSMGVPWGERREVCRMIAAYDLYVDKGRLMCKMYPDSFYNYNLKTQNALSGINEVLQKRGNRLADKTAVLAFNKAVGAALRGDPRPESSEPPDLTNPGF